MPCRRIMHQVVWGGGGVVITDCQTGYRHRRKTNMNRIHTHTREHMCLIISPSPPALPHVHSTTTQPPHDPRSCTQPTVCPGHHTSTKDRPDAVRWAINTGGPGTGTGMAGAGPTGGRAAPRLLVKVSRALGLGGSTMRGLVARRSLKPCRSVIASVIVFSSPSRLARGRYTWGIFHERGVGRGVWREKKGGGCVLVWSAMMSGSRRYPLFGLTTPTPNMPSQCAETLDNERDRARGPTSARHGQKSAGHAHTLTHTHTHSHTLTHTHPRTWVT